MDTPEKKKGQENPKATETITIRTTVDRKMKLMKNAVEKGIPLGTHCEDVLCNSEVSPEASNTQIKELLKMVEDLMEKHSQLQEQTKMQGQTKTLTAQPKPLKKGKAKLEETSEEEIEDDDETTTEDKEELIEKISLCAPEKERGLFIKNVKKMFQNRNKSSQDKNIEETVYKCIKYCMRSDTFFETGRLED